MIKILQFYHKFLYIFLKETLFPVASTGVRLSVERPLKEPRIVDAVAAVPDKGIIGKTFKKDAKAVQEALASLSNEVAEKMDKALSEAGYELDLFLIPRHGISTYLDTWL